MDFLEPTYMMPHCPANDGIQRQAGWIQSSKHGTWFQASHARCWSKAAECVDEVLSGNQLDGAERYWSPTIFYRYF